MERLHVVVQGRVQGVYFRASAQNKARRLGLRGWVRNCADGSVEFVAEGERPELEQLLSWSQAGPPSTTITRVETDWQTARGEFRGFIVRY